MLPLLSEKKKKTNKKKKRVILLLFSYIRKGQAAGLLFLSVQSRILKVQKQMSATSQELPVSPRTLLKSGKMFPFFHLVSDSKTALDLFTKSNSYCLPHQTPE